MPFSLFQSNRICVFFVKNGVQVKMKISECKPTKPTLFFLVTFNVWCVGAHGMKIALVMHKDETHI